jgi:hypothetical protein
MQVKIAPSADSAFALNGVFGNEFPIELSPAVAEEFLKCGADYAFVFDAELVELRQVVVVGGDRFVGWLELQARHGGCSTQPEGVLQ